MADVRDILELERAATPEITREVIMGNEKQKKRFGPRERKRPEGMHREVFALLYNDKNDAPPLLPTDTGNGYKQVKAKLGLRRVRPWAWTSFTNPARADNAVFYHWRRVADEPKEYPFAKFNKQISVVSFTDAEYNAHLQSETWSRAETDHLFDLGKRFDLRFIIMADRWDQTIGKARTVEDLKERYYEICGSLERVRGGTDKKIYVFDAEHERKRKDQLDKQFRRTSEQMEEEQGLVNELKKIEARKRDRERKTQDLQKLISQADSQAETARKADKKLPKKKLHHPTRPSRIDPSVSSKNHNFLLGWIDIFVFQTLEITGIKFPDFKNSGVSLRSQRIKLPANIGQKKTKAIEQSLQELQIGKIR